MFCDRKYLNKALTAAVLVLLLQVHLIKLLHTHADKALTSHELQNEIIAKIKSDCTICDYQLGKDTDDIVCLPACADIQVPADQNAQIILSYRFSSPIAVENKGPPALLFA